MEPHNNLVMHPKQEPHPNNLDMQHPQEHNSVECHLNNLVMGLRVHLPVLNLMEHLLLSSLTEEHHLSPSPNMERLYRLGYLNKDTVRRFQVLLVLPFLALLCQNKAIRLEGLCRMNKNVSFLL